MREEEEGSRESAVEVRIVIHSEEEPLLGRVKVPMKEAPASNSIVSPGCAAFKAACRSPPALTVSVAACVAAELKAKKTNERSERSKNFLFE